MTEPPLSLGRAGLTGDGLLGVVHRQLLADLLIRFQEIQSGRTDVPRIVLLTGGLGTGKSRIVREFYRHLQKQQPDPGYWPSIPEDDAVRGTRAGVDPVPNRKVLGPAVDGFVWHAGALPSFTWWTFDCERMPSGGLVDSVDQARPALQMHLLPAMQAKAAHIGAGEKVLRLLDRAREAGQEGAVEGLSRLVAELAGATVPGLGLVVDWVARSARVASRPTDTEVSFGAASRRSRLYAGEIADLILATVHPAIPAVVVVEDADLMDTDLAEFITKVAAQVAELPVMVIVTARPTGNRVFNRWRTWAEATGNLDHREVPDLTQSDLVQLVRHAAPATTREDAVRVAARYPNPLALKLFLGLSSIARVITRNNGALVLDTLDLAPIPHAIKDLFAQRIADLPNEVRDALLAAAGTLPAVWPTGPYRPGIVATAATAIDADKEDIIAGLDRAVRQGVTVEENGLHSFRESVLAEVLAELVDPLDRAKLQETTRQALREHIAAKRGDRYTISNPSDVDIHAARWLTELIDRTPQTVEDAVAVLAAAGALAATYQFARATELVQRSNALGLLPADHPDTLGLQRELASWTAETGKITEALALLERLLNDQIRVLGPDSSETTKTRNKLARSLGEAGRIGEAVDLTKQVLADHAGVLGPDHPEVLTTRNNLAYLLGEAGRIGEAVDLTKQVLADRTRVLGPDHPDVLTTRNNLAYLLGEAGRIGEAITQLEQLVADFTRVLGPDHPKTLTTRNNLARQLGRTGEVSAAIVRSEQLVAIPFN